MTSWHTYTKSYHHESNLGYGRECQYPLDVTLGTCHRSCIECRKHTDPDYNAHLTWSIFNPQWEQSCYLEYTGNNHGSGMDKCADWSWTLHGIRQPYMQREHGTLASSTNEHEHKCSRQYEATCCDSLGYIGSQEWSSTLGYL